MLFLEKNKFHFVGQTRVKAGASFEMFPPLSCLFLLFGLPFCFPLGVFPLPLLALEKRLYLREQDAGEGLYLVIGNPRAVVIGLLSARHGIPPLKLPLVEQIALKHRAISFDEAAPCILGYLFGGAYKGDGSAYGGKWRPNPNKPQDQRFLGKPGEIKTTYKNGYRVDTKIGEDGRAVTERHYTDHKQPWAHTNPHDHPIHWDNPAEYPDPQPPINYPNETPEFKKYGGLCFMGNTIVPANSPEQNRFTTISDFKTCMRWHGEVEFTWNENLYCITPRSNGKISISMACREDTEKLCDTSDEVLEYMVGSDRLRDVITQVTVLDRTI